MLKIPSIHFKNKILLHFLQTLHIPNNIIALSDEHLVSWLSLSSTRGRRPPNALLWW